RRERRLRGAAVPFLAVDHEHDLLAGLDEGWAEEDRERSEVRFAAERRDLDAVALLRLGLDDRADRRRLPAEPVELTLPRERGLPEELLRAGDARVLGDPLLRREVALLRRRVTSVVDLLVAEV